MYQKAKVKVITTLTHQQWDWLELDLKIIMTNVYFFVALTQNVLIC